jgi:CRISPR-associated protein Csb2
MFDAMFHGRSDSGGPEWPPSPLRAFQALVAAAGQRWRNAQLSNGYVRGPLTWLEELGSPELIAPAAEPSSAAYRLYVPNNHADIVAAAWSGGDQFASIAEHRVEKDVRSTHLAGGVIHYLYPLPNDSSPHLVVLKAAARSITHLGWGIDMTAADADIISEADVAKLPGHRWRIVPGGGVPLRVPKSGTLDDLIRKHKDFLNRLSSDGFRPVAPLRCFDVVGYHSPTVVGLPTPPRPLIAFEIHRTIEDQEREENAGKSRFLPFHHVRRVATVAGMVRHATATVARRIGWVSEDVERRIEGHGDGRDGQATTDDRLMFLPLPSITPFGIGGIRRVLVVGPPGCDLAPLRRRLNGEELIDQESKEPVAMLSGIPTTDRNVARFLAPSRTWSTVTPVILPGYDDRNGLRSKLKSRKTAEQQTNLLARLDARILSLIWKAFHQAGWTDDALAGAEVEYRAVGWFPGVDAAKNYELPPLRFPRYHLRIQFPRAVAGPLAIGGGRYRGVGLFASE